MISDYLYRKASREKIPLNGCFELSPICNFACKMCYVRKTAGQIQAEGKHLRDWTEWLELARQCREAGTLFLLLTGGEPFLYPHFRDLYTALHRMGFLISINSNGTLIDEETVAWLKTVAPSRINITLYGTSPETYERICGNQDGYRRATRAIDMLQEAGIPVVINASMIPENADDLEDIIAFGRKRHLNTRVSTYMFPPMRRDGEPGDSRFTAGQSAEMFLRKQRCLLNETNYHEMCKRYVDQAEKQDSGDVNWGSHGEFMWCRAGRSSFWVSWDGTMSACGMMPFPVQVYPFGRSFHECWMELTNAVRCTSTLAECSGCKQKDNCRPCAAMLYSETGDVNTKAPYLCRLTECITERIKAEMEERDHA